MKFFGFFVIVLVLLTVITTTIVLVIVLNESDDEKKDENENGELFQLSIIHFNDFHARFEETNEDSLPCRDGQKCIGGFARMKTVVDKLMAKRKNAILLNAGDNFQGTFWYNLLRYNVTAHFLNFLPTDAVVIGNHEFAHRVEGLVPFLEMLKAPVVVANIDDSNEPSIQNKYEQSVIIERSGRKIGIIGVILRETSEIAVTDELIFLNEAKSIRNQATKLRQKGANIIIVLSHCGLQRDREIAMETGEFVDVIVGGHSHSFLFKSSDGSFPGPDKPEGTYPIIVTPKSRKDRKVLIVQASAFTKYVGDLTVYFNAAGHVKYYDGNPIFISHDIQKDQQIEEELTSWRDEVNRLGQRVIGHSSVNLMNVGCRHGECALGSFSTDAFVYETQVAFPEIEVFAALIHAAGIRSSIPAGKITYGELVALMPFANTLDIVQLEGEVLIDVFEHSASRSFDENVFIGEHFLQVSGFKVKFNTTNPVGRRLQALQIRSNQSGDFESINPHQQYNIIIPSFIASGGDGFTMIKTNRKNHRVGLLDIDIMEKFIEQNSPISTDTNGRIVMLT
jgi:5'-nucleotidase